ncbi:MAG: tellurite resistance TerB family protein [Desulfobacteraceae bacterium]|nr:tellurite resistance TerB family protein [Desulfobacteraceae bacterium]
MFNPERLLGGLLQSGMRRKGGLGSLISSGAALGLVGVAWEAVEHYMNKSQGAAAPSGAPPMAPPGLPGTTPAPPPPPPGATVAALPPLPQASQKAPPPTAVERQSDAMLLIQAMIAAANADGTIDAQERSKILGKLKSIQLSEEEHQFILHELLEPKSLPAIIDAVTSPELARQVYLVSVLAIEVDTDEEIDYLQALAQGLQLDPQTIQSLHQQAGVEVVF